MLGTKTGALNMSPTKLATLGKLAAAPVARILDGSGAKSYGSNGSPRLERAADDRPDKGGVWFKPDFLGPNRPVGIMRDHFTLNESNWLSRRQRGFARRSRNSLTSMVARWRQGDRKRSSSLYTYHVRGHVEHQHSWKL